MSETFFRPIAVASKDSVAVADGQFILETATGFMYVDWNGQRHHAGYAGPKGDTGPMPTLTVSCTEGAAGGVPSATITEVDSTTRNIHLVIPKGAKGDKGEQGAQGEVGATPNITVSCEAGAEGSTPSATITDVNATTKNIHLVIPKGDRGEQGEQGAKGEQGDDGKDGVAAPGISLVNSSGTASGGIQNVITTPNFNDNNGMVSFNSNLLSGGKVGGYKFNDGGGANGLADVYAKKLYSNGVACITADDVQAGSNVSITKNGSAAVVSAGPFTEVLYSGAGAESATLGDAATLAKYKMLLVKGVFSNSPTFTVCAVMSPEEGTSFKVFTHSVNAATVVIKTATLKIANGVLSSSSGFQGTKPVSSEAGWSTVSVIYNIKEVIGFKV